MRIAFLTETQYEGKWPYDFPNARTEVAWQIALDATHYNIWNFNNVKGYDHVFIIFPKGKTFLNSEGSTLITGVNPVSELLRQDIVNLLKKENGLVHYVQEGPHWWYNDYEIADQIYFYNFLGSCDSIFTHNTTDVAYYKGLFPSKPIRPIGTLMIDTLIKDIVPTKEHKAIVGGNFARWYGGFESYIVADNFNCDIWAQTSHAMRIGEDSVDGIKHLPRMMWNDWMKSLSTFKYGVHLMPTVAAGTFALNCAYFGIPCIGNEDVDTQLLCHPSLSVEVYDIAMARDLAIRLRDDEDFYNQCSELAKENYKQFYSVERWKERMENYLK